jgi:hypothetical protein
MGGIVYSFAIPFLKERIIVANTELLPAPTPEQNVYRNFKISPEKGQIGTVFQFKIELVNKTDSFWADIDISKSGKKIGTVHLYDDGNHGDQNNKDGIYAGSWNSEGIIEGIYTVGLSITPGDAVFKNVSEIQLFRERCTPLKYSGDPNEKVDVTLLAYGYSDFEEFKSDALKWINTGLLTYEPFKNNSEKFNFYAIEQDAGFSCTKQGTLVYCDNEKVMQQASQCPADQIVVLLKDASFCGSATDYITVCNGATGFEKVVTHEFGHTFGGLGDEYSYSEVYPGYKAAARLYPNCDSTGCSKWISFNPGCFAKCGVDELFRPIENNCLMNRYVNVFCPVCQKHMSDILSNYISEEAQTNVSEQGASSAVPAPVYEKTYIVGLNYESGNLSLNDIYVTKSISPDRKALRKIDYTGKIISFDGKEILSFNFELPNILYPAPPLNENETAIAPFFLDKINWAVPAPQSDEASKLEVYDNNQNKVLSADIGYLSESCGNNKCESHETALDCPNDCRNIQDGVCNNARDRICDPDCPEIDPDCQKISTALIITLIVSSIVMAVIIIILIVKFVLLKPAAQETTA